MGLKNKFKTFFLLDDEEQEMAQHQHQEYTDDEQVEGNYPVQQTKKNVVSLQSVQKSNSKLVLIEPRVYADSQDIADHLKSRRAVVVNLQRIQNDQARRIIDFLSGTVYAIGGDIQKIGSNIFLCTPDNVEVSGNISELLQETEYHDTGWS